VTLDRRGDAGYFGAPIVTRRRYDP
jgi:hypothetical protein